MKTNYKLRGSDKIFIIPISDLHFGSEQFNEPYFKYRLDLLDKLKSDYRIYLCGDLAETASKSVGNSAFKTDFSVDEQLDYIIKTFRPYKKNIVNSTIGNHEARLVREFDLDMNAVVAEALRIPHGNQFLDRFFINQQEYIIYSAHGKGSSAHHYTAQSKMIRDTAHIRANILMHGHNHRCDHFSVPAFKVLEDGKLGIDRRHYIMTGSFLKYNGYAAAMQLPILPEAFIQLSINKDLRINSTQFNIDECRPELMELGM